MTGIDGPLSGIERPLYKDYPRVEALAQALVAAAAERGATAGELEMACQLVQGRVKSYVGRLIEKEKLGLLVSVLTGDT